jgi:hypothetical protein
MQLNLFFDLYVDLIYPEKHSVHEYKIIYSLLEKLEINENAH